MKIQEYKNILEKEVQVYQFADAMTMRRRPLKTQVKVRSGDEEIGREQ